MTTELTDLCVPNEELTAKTIARWRDVFTFLCAGPRNSTLAKWEYDPNGRPDIYPNNPSLALTITSRIGNGKNKPDSTLCEQYILAAEEGRAKVNIQIRMENPALGFFNAFNTTTGWQHSPRLIPQLASRLPLFSGGDIVGTPSLRWELSRVKVTEFFPIP